MEQAANILIVEDEAITALWLEYELKRRGFSVTAAVATGEDAVTSARQSQPDIVLMDIRLAGSIDGIEAANEIRTFCPALIIFMTGYADGQIKERALKITNAKYFTKPFRLKELLAAFSNATG